MGNAPGSFRLLGNGDGSYHFQLGKLASISMKGETKWEDNGKRSKKWEVSYNVEGLTCTLSIIRSTGINSDEELRIDIEDNTYRKETNSQEIKEYSGFGQSVGRAEAGLLNVEPMTCFGADSTTMLRSRRCFRSSSKYDPYTKKTTNSSGGVTSMTICPYGSSGTRKGLYVTEWKKKKENEKPYMGTIEHYYANNSEKLFKRGIDVGLSMVKIRVSNDALFGTDKLDFTVDGPVQHPSSALFYMIEEVTRTGMWTPRACPHCANIQKQRRWQSESERQ